MIELGTTLTLTPEQVEEMNHNTKVIINDAMLSHLCWVKVSDKLPEDNKEVLAGYYYDNQFEVIVAWYSHDFQHWIMEDHDRLAISHWMPLPEPPKD